MTYKDNVADTYEPTDGSQDTAQVNPAIVKGMLAANLWRPDRPNSSEGLQASPAEQHLGTTATVNEVQVLPDTIPQAPAS